MILNRLGNKSAIAHKIIQHFPEHKTFIDMFFGAGGLFFNKPQAKYNFCNDFDDDVFNLWQVFQTKKDDLVDALMLTPYSDSVFQYYRKNTETDPIKKAVRFLFLSNFGYMGKQEILHFNTENKK